MFGRVLNNPLYLVGYHIECNVKYEWDFLGFYFGKSISDFLLLFISLYFFTPTPNATKDQHGKTTIHRFLNYQ